MRSSLRIPLAITLLLALASRLFAITPPTLDDATFTRIVGALEAKRLERHIPGMVLAVVLSDGTTRIQTFGERDIEGHRAVEKDTLFGIASTTKTFTAVLTGVAVGEGVLSFDDPVRKHLPWFTLSDQAASEACTLRDLLSHRTGLTRTDAIMGAQGVAPGITRREAVEQLAKAELLHPFRSQFQYNNQMFLVAGLATAAALGDPSELGWDALLQARLLGPLGMARTTSSHAKAFADPTLSLGYRWDEASLSQILMPSNGFDLAAPAGALYSTGPDMARWVLMLLQRGSFEGRQIVPAAQLEELWTQQIEMIPGSGLGYGMGFMLQQWRGHALAKHGGNLDGFSTQLALLPEVGAGFVLLTNNAATSLPEEAIDIVFGHLMDALHDQAPAAAAADLAPLLGCYEFGPTKSSWFVVPIAGGKLGLDVPKQRIYTLAEPDAEGMRTLVELPVAKLRFDRAADGHVTQIWFVQGGQTLVMPRTGDEACAAEMAARSKPLAEGAPMPVAMLHPYLGVYRFTQANQDWEVLINDRGRLAIDVPGQKVYGLRWPNEKGRWVFEDTDAIEVSFVTRTAPDATGAQQSIVDGLTVFQLGQAILMSRATPPADLPTLEATLALLRKAMPPKAVRSIASLKGNGIVRMPHQGIEGTLSIEVVGRERLLHRMDFGRFGFVVLDIDHGKGTSSSSMGPPRALATSEVEEGLRQHPLTDVDEWATRYVSMRVVGTRIFDTPAGPIETIVLRLRTTRGTAMTTYVDTKSGDIVREDGSIDIAGVMSLPYTNTYSDFRDVGGVRVPFRVVIDNSASGRTEIILESLQP